MIHNVKQKICYFGIVMNLSRNLQEKSSHNVKNIHPLALKLEKLTGRFFISSVGNPFTSPIHFLGPLKVFSTFLITCSRRLLLWAICFSAATACPRYSLMNLISLISSTHSSTWKRAGGQSSFC